MSLFTRLFCTLFLSCICLNIGAAGPALPHLIPKTEDQLSVDGRLDESLWKDALHLELDYEVRPGENIKPPVRTEMLMIFNETALLVAFVAHDPNPERIRARFTDRDQLWDDDWVGVVLDTFNDERRAYELVVNPLGVQMDAVNDDMAGNYDTSWNAIWSSAGQITERGFQVELMIPFNQLRFQDSDGPQVWGIDGVRSYPRQQRHHIGLFARDRGSNSYLAQEEKLKGFSGADPGRNLQLVPTVTAGRTDSLGESGLDQGSTNSDVGLTARWGITSNATLSGTINPDFSQVEADVVRLGINEQFALFFPESRPFFLEGQDYFDTSMDLVHTRTLADPSAAVKLTSKAGPHTFGIFSAQDEVTNILIPGNQASRGSSFESESQGSVARYRYDFGRNSTVGALLTHRDGEEGYRNSSLSMDLRYRLNDEDLVAVNLAHSQTRYDEDMRDRLSLDPEEISDQAISFEYQHSERNWDAEFSYEDYGEDFRGDLGFLPRVGYNNMEVGGSYTWHGKPGDFYNRLVVASNWDQTRESDGSLIERETEALLVYLGPKESEVSLLYGIRTRVHQNIDYEQDFYSFYLEATPSGAFHFQVQGSGSDWIDFDHGRAADRFSFTPAVRWNLGKSLKMDLRYAYSKLDVAEGRLFEARVPELRVNYFFNTRTFVRLVSQYTDIRRNLDNYDSEQFPDVDSRSQDLLGQFLFSYKLNPQTVAYAGYSNTYLGDDMQSLTESSRTFFVKLGYAWLQ